MAVFDPRSLTGFAQNMLNTGQFGDTYVGTNPYSYAQGAVNSGYNEETGWADASQMNVINQINGYSSNVNNGGGGNNWMSPFENMATPQEQQYVPNTGTGLYPGMAQSPGYTVPGGGTNTPPPAQIASPALMANSMGMQGAQNVGGMGMYTGANAPLDMSRFAPNGIDQAMMNGSMGGFGEALFAAAQQNGMNPGTSYLGFMDDLSRRTLQAKGGQGGLLPQDFVNYLQSQGGQQWVNSQRTPAQPQTPQTPQGPQIQQTGPPTQPSAPRPPYGQPPQNTQYPMQGGYPTGGLDPGPDNRPEMPEHLRRAIAQGIQVGYDPSQFRGGPPPGANNNQRYPGATGTPVIGSPGMMGRPGQMQVDPAMGAGQGGNNYYSRTSQLPARNTPSNLEIMHSGWPSVEAYYAAQGGGQGQQPNYQQMAAQFSSDPAAQQAYLSDMLSQSAYGAGYDPQQQYLTPNGIQGFGGQSQPDFRAATFGGGSIFPAATGSGSGSSNIPNTTNPSTSQYSTPGWGGASNRRSGFGGMSLFGNGMGGGNTGGGQTYGQPASQYRGAGSYGRPASYGQSQRPY